MNDEHDDDMDLSTLDRGDHLEPPTPAPEPEPGDIETPEKPGAEASAAGEAEEAKPDAALAADSEDGQPRDDQGRFARKPEEEEGADNLPIRLNKAKAQRDAERARADAAEARLRELEGSTASPAPEKTDPVETLNTEIDALYEQVEEARLDGDAKLAAQLQREIDTKNRAIAKLEAVKETMQASTQAREAAQYNRMLDTLESQVEEVNPASKNYDPQLVAELEFQVHAYTQAGMSPPEALSRACALLFRSNVGGENPATPDKQPPTARKPDVEKALETARRQPPDIAAKGVDPGPQKIDVRTLSDDEFDALPEKVKARLRGDEY